MQRERDKEKERERQKEIKKKRARESTPPTTPKPDHKPSEIQTPTWQPTAPNPTQIGQNQAGFKPRVDRIRPKLGRIRRD